MRSELNSADLILLSFVLLGGLSLGCGKQTTGIKIGGSSTVYPISEAVAEEFCKTSKEIRVTVGRSGTGGGIKRFIAGEIDICNASRPLKESEEEACKKAKIEYLELSIALDGLTVVTSQKNNWCDSLTVEQLAQIWRPNNPSSRWNEINADWPDEKIKLYGPGTNSGTFDYFTQAIVGEAGASRPDYAASEDDNVLVTGVSEDKYSLGYFGYAYYVENKERLKLISVKPTDSEAVKPSAQTVRTNKYQPLSRPLYIYVLKSCYEKPEGKAFVDFYLDKAAEMSSEVGYVPISDEVVAANAAVLNSM